MRFTHKLPKSVGHHHEKGAGSPIIGARLSIANDYQLCVT